MYSTKQFPFFHVYSQKRSIFRRIKAFITRPLGLLCCFMLSFMLFKMAPFTVKNDMVSSDELQEIEYDSDNTSSIVRLKNFKTCKIFEGAIFDASAVDKPANVEVLVDYIENKAQEFLNYVKKKYQYFDLTLESSRRFACYESVTHFRLVHHDTESSKKFFIKANMANYFPEIPFRPNPSPNPYPAKIAYLLMVHEVDDPSDDHNRVMKVLNSILSSNSYVLIHVDARSNNLFESLREATQSMPNVLVTGHRIDVEWGFSSMVSAELAGFFELLDVAEWDFVINLSAHDYPVRSTEYIDKHLIKDHIYITFWEDKETTNGRILKTIFHNTIDEYNTVQLRRRHNFPFPELKITKHHQWMILPRSYINYLRTEDYKAHELLMFMENSIIPDEWFFSTSLSRLDHPFAGRIINDNKRMITRFNGSHPIPITNKSIPFLRNALFRKDYFLARKVDCLVETEVIKWMDGVRVSKNPFGRESYYRQMGPNSPNSDNFYKENQF